MGKGLGEIGILTQRRVERVRYTRTVDAHCR